MRFRPPSTVNASPARFRAAAMGCALTCLLLAAACRNEPAPSPERTEEATPATPQPVTQPPPEASAPLTQPVVRSAPPSLPDSVTDLNARFHARTATPEDRDEIIKSLGRLEAQRALPVLRRVFEEEKRLELRMRVLEVAADLPADAAPGRWELFARATEARQPVLMRLSAMQTIGDSEDPRAVPLLQQLARDSNASIRENAKRILKERLVP